MFNKRVKVKELLALEPTNQEITVMGWVRSFRNNQFMALNDGSTNNNIQVVLELGKFDEATLKRISTSASVKVTGILIPSLGKGQKSEVKALTLEILGDYWVTAWACARPVHRTVTKLLRPRRAYPSGFG